MPNYLRDLLSFPGMPQGQTDEFDLRSLMQQAPPPMPQQRNFRPMQVPPRPQPQFAELLPQLLAGAGDVLSARRGGRSDYLGRVQGMQEGRRQQTWNDAMMQTQINQQAEDAAYGDAWHRFVAQQGGQDRKFNQGMKYAEFGLMRDALAKQKADAEKQMNFQKFMYGLSAGEKLKDAGGPEELKDMLQKGMLQARSPEELQALQEESRKQQAKFVAQQAYAKKFEETRKQVIEESRKQGPKWGSLYLRTEDAGGNYLIDQEVIKRIGPPPPK